MTLEQAKLSAPKLTNFLENQFIVGRLDDCHILTMYGAMDDTVLLFNNQPILSSRVFAPTDYANDQQGAWVDKI